MDVASDRWAESKADSYKNQGESEDIYTENAFLKEAKESLKEQIKDLKEFIEIEEKRNAVLQAEIKALKKQAPLKNLRERENDLPTEESEILPHNTWTHAPKGKFKSKNGSWKIQEKKGYKTNSDDYCSVKDVTVKEPQDNNLLPKRSVLKNIKGFFTHGFKKKIKSTQESHIKRLNIPGWSTHHMFGIEVYLPDPY